MKILRMVVPMALLTFALATTQVRAFAAASDYLLEIDGIKGEVKDPAHIGAIELHSFSFGASNSGGNASVAGGGTGKVSFHDISVTKHIDSASTALFMSCLGGKRASKATLTCRKAGGDQQE